MAAGWNKGKKWSEDVKKRISEAMKCNHPMRGKHWTLEQRKRMSEARYVNGAKEGSKCFCYLH